MKMVKPSFEIVEPQSYDLPGMYKHIELCGRVCYKSEDKITDSSADAFIKRMNDSGHLSVLEHGTIFLHANNWMDEHDGKNISWDEYIEMRKRYTANKYSHCIEKESASLYITTNYRVIIENGWEDDLKYMCVPTEHHVKRISVKFVLDRGVSHEFVRHKVMSYSQESTRFCCYLKSRFGSSVSFIVPPWLKEEEREEFEEDLKVSEALYFKWLNKGWTAQQARGFLVHFLKTELIVTAFVDKDGWSHFFDLRALGTTGAPHPQAKELALPLMEEFRKRGYIE